MNGARGQHAVDDWDEPTDPVYDWARDAILAPQRLSEAQVQAIWLKQANRQSPTRPPLPAADADAYVLLEALGRTVRALRVRYPNLQQVFLSSRTMPSTQPIREPTARSRTLSRPASRSSGSSRRRSARRKPE